MFYGLKYINDLGDSILFGSEQYKVIEFEGFGEVGADIQTQKAPYQDGSTHIDSRLQERYPSIVFVIRGEQYSDLVALRRHVGRVFSPKISGILSIIHEGEEYFLRCVSEHVPAFPDNGTDAIGRMQTVTVDLKAPNPYWQSGSDTVEQLVTFSGGLTFPLRLPTIFGNQESKAKSRIIVNNGDSPTPIEITFEGPATTPIRIDNETTGEFIEVNQSLLEGEQLWISTTFGHKRVEKILVDGTRINAFHHILVDPTGAGPSSTFFQLQPGNNLMTYNTGVEYEKAPVTIRFQPRYLAI